jgi:mono/diheme cytochrome c family protein
MHRSLTALLVLAAVMALPRVAAAANVANGERLAKRWCAACHIVASDQTHGNTQVAPFSAIAKTPGLDAGKIAFFLLLPHPKMPDMSLTRDEAADLAAYIASQGR